MKKKAKSTQNTPEKVEIHVHIHPENPLPNVVLPENKPEKTYMVPQIPVYFPYYMRPVFTLPTVTCLGI